MSKQAKLDVYQHITDRFIEALNEGITPWTRPWKARDLPHNAGSGRRYNGINVFLLQFEAYLKDYTTNGWLTFNQAKKLGGHVRKGEKGTLITYWNLIRKEREDPDTGKTETVFIPFLRYHYVWNVDQCDGLPETFDEPLEQSWANDVTADDFIVSVGVDVRFGGDRAYYHPREDYVQLPALEQFKDAPGYYSTAFHELVHWTGHKSRLNRHEDKRGFFGDPTYAFEELVAEFGAAFLCAEFGIENEDRHHGYLDSWLKLLKEDNRAVVRAAGKASKAVTYLLVEGGYVEPEPEDEEEMAATEQVAA